MRKQSWLIIFVLLLRLQASRTQTTDTFKHHSLVNRRQEEAVNQGGNSWVTHSQTEPKQAGTRHLTQTLSLHLGKPTTGLG
jgi:hypothetical protein